MTLSRLWNSKILRCALVLVPFLAILPACGESDSEGAAAVETKATAPSPFEKFTVNIDGLPRNLAQGQYLIAMLSASCEHCRASVPTLNEYAYIPELPTLVALMLGNEKEIAEFRLLTEAEFVLHSVEARDFFEFINTAPPRLLHIHDGQERHSWEWEDEPPEVEEILTELESS